MVLAKQAWEEFFFAFVGSFGTFSQLRIINLAQSIFSFNRFFNVYVMYMYITINN